MIGTQVNQIIIKITFQDTLGVGPSNKATLFVILSPVGPYYKTGFAAVSLLADVRFVRAWPGGTGSSKVGGYMSFEFLISLEIMRLALLLNWKLTAKATNRTSGYLVKIMKLLKLVP